MRNDLLIARLNIALECAYKDHPAAVMQADVREAASALSAQGEIATAQVDERLGACVTCGRELTVRHVCATCRREFPAAASPLPPGEGLDDDTLRWLARDYIRQLGHGTTHNDSPQLEDVYIAFARIILAALTRARAQGQPEPQP